MKYLFFIILVMLLNVSCKKEWTKNVTVVRDCTGTYLRVESKDYQVCNLEKVSSFPNGAIVKADFKSIQICSSAKPVACYLFHQNEGWIEVNEIK